MTRGVSVVSSPCSTPARRHDLTGGLSVRQFAGLERSVDTIVISTVDVVDAATGRWLGGAVIKVSGTQKIAFRPDQGRRPVLPGFPNGAGSQQIDEVV